MSSDDTEQAELRAAIRNALSESGLSQERFGAEVAHHEDQDAGRRKGTTAPYSQTTVAGWFSKPVWLRPARVFAIERALKLRPGTLSKLEGYLPAGITAPVTVEEALAADPDITPEQASMLLAAVRAARESTRSRPARRRRAR